MKVMCIYHPFKYRTGQNLKYGKVYDVLSVNNSGKIELLNEYNYTHYYIFDKDFFVNVTHLVRKVKIKKLLNV